MFKALLVEFATYAGMDGFDAACEFEWLLRNVLSKFNSHHGSVMALKLLL